MVANNHVKLEVDFWKKPAAEAVLILPGMNYKMVNNFLKKQKSKQRMGTPIENLKRGLRIHLRYNLSWK